MILGLAVVWGLALALLGGGRLRELRQVSLRHEGLILGLFVVQGIVRGWLPLMAEWHRASVVIWACASLGLLMVLCLNLDKPGMSIIMLGLALNLFVVLANSGMPVSAPSAGLANTSLNAGFYHRATAADIGMLLGDVLPFPGGWMLSAGDLLLAVGAAAYLAASCSMSHPSLGARTRLV